ncbi:unnamed protein product [Closterium sp. NIES-64]|nr:unnamed protein product [Closterium sp. NIES-64]
MGETASRQVNARIALETATTPAVHSITTTSSSSSSYGSTSGSTAGSTSGKSEPPPIITSVVMHWFWRLSFRRQRCLNIEKGVQRRDRVFVFWNVDSTNEKSGGLARGVQCKQVQFFDKSNCKGTARDTIHAAYTLPMPYGVYASRSIPIPVSCPFLFAAASDPACAALGCGPDGTCVFLAGGRVSMQFLAVGRVSMQFLAVGRVSMQFLAVGRVSMQFLAVGRVSMQFLAVGRVSMQFLAVGRVSMAFHLLQF